MKIETIYVLERKNLGNYEHIEMSATAKIEENEDALASMLTLKTLVSAALNGKAAEIANTKVDGPVTYDEETKTNLPVEEVKAKKARAKKAADVTQIAPSTEEVVGKSINQSALVEENVKTAAKKVVKYSRSIDAHKTLLSSTLTTNFPNWKTSKEKTEIVAFTTSLEGKDFVDEDGIIVESFKQVLSGFFA